jgi:DNA-binding Lrp family transcriptional regulator
MKQFKGLPAFVAMKIGTKVDSHQIISSLLKIHDVENVFEVTGEYDIIAIVRAKVSS